MYNMLLDRYPVEYKGYLIRSDYRVGIQIMLVLEDSDLEDDERVLKALELLYGYGIPDDIVLAMNGLKWFMSGGKVCCDDEGYEYLDVSDIDNEVKDTVEVDEEKAFDFEIDHDIIYASMYQQYKLEIDKERIHWFRFLAMFKGLKDTQINDLMYYRTVDINKLPKSQREEMSKLQKQYRINKLTAQRKDELFRYYGNEWRDHIND